MYYNIVYKNLTYDVIESNNSLSFFISFSFVCSIWVQLLDRRQKRLELALLAADQFLDLNTIRSSDDWHNWTPSVNVICSQVSEVWINVHDILHFFPYEKNSSTLSFIWASEETGWRHLYLFTSTLTPHLNGVADGDHGEGRTIFFIAIKVKKKYKKKTRAQLIRLLFPFQAHLT